MPFPSTIYIIYTNITQKIVNARQEIAKIVGILILLLLKEQAVFLELWKAIDREKNRVNPNCLFKIEDSNQPLTQDGIDTKVFHIALKKLFLSKPPPLSSSSAQKRKKVVKCAQKS